MRTMLVSTLKARLTLSRPLHTSARRLTDFGNRPAPPRLPSHLQKEFEELQRKAAMPLSSESLASTGVEAASISSDQSLHPDVRSKPKPEFDGDMNPNTGEVGGPKNNPLSYEKEWTYGGRATDF